MTHQDLPAGARVELPSEGEAFIPTRLGRVHVRTTGNGALTVLWPSMFVDSHTWDPILGLLPRDRRYVLVDPPGLGLSDPLARVTNIVEAADAAIDLLQGLGADEPVDWVGNAFGGHVGFELGARPGTLRSLVAISSPTQAVGPALRAKASLLLPVLRTLGPVGPVRSAILSTMLTDAGAACAPIRQVVLGALGRPTRRSLALAVRSFILNRVDVAPLLPRLEVPSLFVASDDRGDWTPEDAASAAALVDRAEVITIRAARTLVPLEQPSALAGSIRKLWEAFA